MQKICHVDAFDEILLRYHAELTVQQVAGPAMVTITAHPRLLERLRSEVRGQRLYLEFDLRWWEWLYWWLEWLFVPNKHIFVTVQTEMLRAVVIEGAGRLRINEVQTDSMRLAVVGSGDVLIQELQAQEVLLEVRGSGKLRLGTLTSRELKTLIGGSGDIELAGRVEQQVVQIGGSGNYQAPALESGHARVDIHASGRAVLNVKHVLRVGITGAGDVRYLGQPEVQQEIRGAGVVKPF